MIANKNTHYFQCRCENLHGERFLIYRNPGGSGRGTETMQRRESRESREETPTLSLAEAVREAGALRDEIKSKPDIKLEIPFRGTDRALNKIAQKFSQNNRTQIKRLISLGISSLEENTMRALASADKVTIELKRGILNLKAGNINESISLFEFQPLKMLQSLERERAQALEQHEQAHDEVRRQNQEQLRRQSAEVENTTPSLDSFINSEYRKYIRKEGDTYRIDFKERGRINRKAQRETTLQHIFNLSNTRAHIEIEVKGRTGAGRANNYVAVYHPGQRRFMIKGTGERATIFHGNQITLRQYTPFVERSEEDRIITPQTREITEQERQKRREELKKRQERYEERREILRYDLDNSLWEEYSSTIFGNKVVSTPSFLRDDKHFRRNWKRVDTILEDSLSRPPFNITTTENRRKYIQAVIQRFRNPRLHPSDFFRYKMAGRYLYKDSNGYSKFRRDYLRIRERGSRNEEEDRKLNELEEIVYGIARVLDALNRLTVHDKQPESPEQTYRPTLLGVAEMTEAEKEEVRRIPRNNFHNLESLLHRTENAPSGISIGATNAQFGQLQGVIKKAAAEIPPPFNIEKYLAGADQKGGLKLLFMAYGLDELIKKGCIKKYDDTKYILVKVPSNESEWIATLMRVKQESAELWDTNKESFRKWQRIRESLDSGVKSKEFIATIFSPLDSGKIKQEINWWKRLWHWEWDKEKNISMEYLGNATIDPSEYERFMVEARGYHDMIEKTSKRIEGTTLYEPQEAEVVNLTNRYLEYGLLATFMQASNKDLPKVMKGVIEQFGLQGRVTIVEPLTKDENKIENLRTIHEAVMLKDMNRNALSESHIKFIRLGHVLGRYIETSKNWSESMQEHLSSNPMYREIQLEALRQGCPVNKLDEVAQRIHVALFGYSEGLSPAHVKALGGAVGVELGRWAQQDWYASFALIGTDGKVIPAASIGAAIQAGQFARIRWNIGTTIGFTGASAAIEFPVTNEWDMFLSAGAGISWSGGTAGVGAGVGARWNRRRAERLNETRAQNERGVGQISSALASGNTREAAKLILKNETFGAWMQLLKDRINLSDYVICDIYRHAESRWIQAAREGIKIPPVIGFGVGAFLGLSGATPAVGGVGAYVTFKIPGTEITYVVRHEHPKFSERAMRSISEEELKKQLEKEGLRNTVISRRTISGSSGLLYFDQQLGRSHVARPRNLQEARQSLAIRESEQSADLSEKSSFDAIKRTFLNIDIHAEKVQDPKNPEGNLIALTPLQTEGSNVEILIDPELQSKGLILDRQNNRVLLAASDAKKLYATRTRYRYPHRRRGALNIDVIAFKTASYRTNAAIREDSPNYIYRYKGERYTMVQGAAATGLESGASNTVTLEQYKQRQRSFETFRDHRFEYNIEEGRNLTREMHSALEVREMPQIRAERLKLKDFGEDWFKKNRTNFNRRVSTISNPAQEDRFRQELFNTLQEDFRGFAENQNISLETGFSLNDPELNLVYNQLLDESFTQIRAGGNERRINERLRLRNELFRNFMTEHINNFKNSNPEKWNLITQMDPSITVESIVNYLALCMPQNLRQLEEFEAGTSLEIGEGLKYATYTRKRRPGTKNVFDEAIPSSFGVENPEGFKDIFKILSPTELKINSPNPTERAAARLVLQMMSPAHLEKLNTLEGKEKFLKSELSLTVISLYDERMRVSPLIQVMGKTNYKGMIQIYKAFQKRNSNPEIFRNALETHARSFEIFKEIVTGIRNAQINGDKVFVFNNKYIFHLEETSMHAGPYLKCANGTVTLRQRIGITTTEERVQRWYAPERRGYNILVDPESKKKAATLTAGWVHGFRPEGENGKRKGGLKDEEPAKTETPGESEGGQISPGGTSEGL